MATTPVNPGTGLPNINPAYFPAFTTPIIIPTTAWDWQYAPPVISLQQGPTVRVPPFVMPPAPSPPTPPAPETDEELEDFLTRCTTYLEGEGVDGATAEAACQGAWDEAHPLTAPLAASTNGNGPKKRRRKE